MMDGKSVVRPRSYFIGAAALIMAGVVLGLGLSAGLNLQRSSNATSAELAAVTHSAPLPESPFVGVVDKALPAVVFIDVRKRAADSDDPNDEFMRRFFGDNGSRRQQRVPSSGSGFLVTPNGRIITNNHVVANADEITVTLNDRRQFKAKVVGADPETDVAVIQVEGKDLPFLPLGDSDNLRVGDWAIAIGNPLGELRGSVTVGIVSAQGRTNLNIFGGTPGYQDFIQTDAAINFGNSGGPLCNIRGEVIGINTAINTSGQGIGFAVPINLAKHVADQLVAHGTVKRSMLGVLLAEMTPEMAEGFGLAGQQGVLIQSVMDDSPAARAGLKRNDIIVEYEGHPVSEMAKLRLKVADTPAGTKVNLVVLRDGKRMPFSVVLKDRDDRTAVATPDEGGNDRSSLGGLTVRGLKDLEMSKLKIDSGVMVTEVEDGSPADERGLQPGDIIEQVGQTPVSNPEDFARLMAAQKRTGRPAVLFVNRNGSGQYVTFRLDK